MGGTLLHANPSVGGVYARVAARHGVHATPEELEHRFRDAWRRLKVHGATNQKSWWRTIVQDVFSHHAPEMDEALFQDLYESFRDPAAWALFPDVFPTLNALREKGIRMAIASNWDERLPALLDGIGLTPFFEKRFISYDLGVSKPDQRFFRAALAGMDVDPLEAIHVGDDETEDIRGAESSGIRAYLINRQARPLNSRMLVDLSEILARV